MPGRCKDRRFRVTCRAPLLGGAALFIASHVVAAAQQSPENPAYEDTKERTLLPYTTHVVARGHLALGLLSIDYGLFDGFSLGTDPPAWAARAILPFWVPNLHVKWAFWQRPGLRLAAQIGGYFAGVDRDDDEAKFIAVPTSLYASTPILPRLEVHLEGSYVYARGWGIEHSGDFDLEGAVATAGSLQFGALFLYRLSDLVRLTLRGRTQVYGAPLTVRGDPRLDEFTTAHIEAELTTASFRWMVAPGAALLWPRVHLWLGVGYGNFFLPGVLFPRNDTTIVPDGALYVIF